MQTVLREIEFNNWVMRLNLKDLGGFWIRGYVHTAPSSLFYPEEIGKLEEIVRRCESSTHLRNIRQRTIGGRYHLLQVDVPIRLMGPRNYSLTQLKDFFSRTELSKDPRRNAYFQDFARRMLDYPQKARAGIQEFRRFKHRQQNNGPEFPDSGNGNLDHGQSEEKKHGRHLLKVKELKYFLKTSCRITGARLEMQPYYEQVIDYLFSFLERGHPLKCRLKKDKTPKIAVPGPLPEDFIKRHYVECAEINIAPEGSIVEVDSRLEHLLYYRRTFVNEAFQQFNRQVTEFLVSRNRSLRRSNFTQIEKFLEEHYGPKRNSGKNSENAPLSVGIKTKTRAVGGELSDSVISAWDIFQQMRANLVSLGKDLGGCEVRPNYQQEVVDLWFDGDISKLIRFVRMRSAEEIRAETWWLVDWENFEFGTEHADISMGATGFLKKGAFSGGRVRSLQPIGLEKVGGLAVEDDFHSSKELIADSRDEFKMSGASIAVSYYTPYDLIEPRKYEKFSLGSLDREPRKVSTIPFFERIGIPARDVIDPLRWAMIQYDFLPDCKLVTIAKKIDEEEHPGTGRTEKPDLEKIINYRHGRELEIGRRTGCWDHLSPDTKKILETFHCRKFEELEDKVAAAGQLQAHYVAKDLEKLTTIIQSQRFQQAMDDIGYISQLFGVDFFLLMHDPKRMDRWLSRVFFQKSGTWRTEMMPKYKNLTRAEGRAQAYFAREKAKLLPVPAERGFFDNVYLVFIPVSRFFREEIFSFMGEFHQKAEKLFAYADQHQGDPLRNYFLSKYERAIFEWLEEDYTFYCHTRYRYEKMKQKLRVNSGEVLDSEVSLFSILYHQLLEIASGENDGKILRQVREGRLDQKSLRRGITSLGEQFGKELGLEMKDLQALLNLWIHKKNQAERIACVYGCDTAELDAKFQAVYSQIGEYLHAHDLRLVQAQNNFLYLQGDKKHLTAKDSPFILLDELERVYVTEHPSERRKDPGESSKKIYYSRCGSWEGLKDDEEATYWLTLFEMEIYQTFLKQIFAGEEEEAKEQLSLALDSLASKKVPLEELVWYNKNKKQYRAFEAGKKIFFYDWNLGEIRQDETGQEYIIRPAEDGQGEKINLGFDSSSGRHYFEEVSQQRVEDTFGRGKYIQERKRVYLMPVTGFQPDWEKYWQRVSERAEILLGPLMGKEEAKKFVEESRKMAGDILGGEMDPVIDYSGTGQSAEPPEVRLAQPRPPGRAKKQKPVQPLLPFRQK